MRLRVTLSFCAVVSLAVSAIAQSITALVPSSAPSWSRAVIYGTGLDAAGLRVEFPIGDGPTPPTVDAPVFRRSSSELEIAVPVGAVTGNVRLTSGGVTHAQVPFTVTAVPAPARVRTVADRQRDPSPNERGPGLAMADDTRFFIADTGLHQIYEVRSDGTRTLYAGTGQAGHDDGPRLSATFTLPNGLVYDTSIDALYVSSTGNHRVRRIDANGTVSTLAGSLQGGYADGTGTAARFRDPKGLAVDAAGNVFVADTGNHAVRRITPAGVVTTVAGGRIGFRDGAGVDALFDSPRAVAFHRGELFVADTGNKAIRRLVFDANGNATVSTIVRTISGTPAPRLEEPAGIALDGYGNLFVTDSTTHQIFRVTMTSVVTVVAGAGTLGYTDGAVASALFYEPAGIVYAGQLYVQDWENRAVRTVESNPLTRDLHPRSGLGGTMVRLFGHGFLSGGTEVRFGARWRRA